MNVEGYKDKHYKIQETKENERKQHLCSPV